MFTFFHKIGLDQIEKFQAETLLSFSEAVIDFKSYNQSVPDPFDKHI